MKVLLFDSSFLIAVIETPTTWYEDILERVGSFKPTVLDVVKEELERLSRRNVRRSRFASLALELTSSFNVASARSKTGQTDDEIISYAKEKRATVATVDGELMKRLKALRVPIVTLRRGRVFV